MPERPLLKLPNPVPFQPGPGPRAVPNLAKPDRARQGQRLGPRFDRLTQVANDPDALMAFRNDPMSIAPERAVVFEVAGQLADFYEQARALGLEYLADYEDDIEPSADFYDQKKPSKVIPGRIYLAMPDVEALRQVLSLWQIYKSGGRMPSGRSAWRDLFSMLVDVRPWGPKDRVPPETVEFWQEQLARNPDDSVRFEIELWFHEGTARRARASERLEKEVHRLGGNIVVSSAIPEIRYHAALVDIPPAQIQELIDNTEITLARMDDIMFLRPQSLARSPTKEEEEGEEVAEGRESPLPANANPVAALLDGLPIQNHTRLVDRLSVDDPEGLEEVYPVQRREHGTAMASLIIHGDLTSGEAPIQRPLMVRPVMRPAANGGEHTPANELLVDVIYRAVRRIKDGEGGEPATAPQVTLINVSLGDDTRPFARVMSPLARLLDFLAYRYRVLLLVSAGNITDRLEVPDFRTAQQFENAEAEQREKSILAAMNNSKSHRTLFSPAEAINVLTIGAAHSSRVFDGSLPGDLIDPFTDGTLPNIASALGLGYRRTIKPDLLFEGGRAPVRVVATGDSLAIQPAQNPAKFFGARAAFPHRRGGTGYEDYTWGTSVATALTTRAGHRIFEALMDGEAGSNHTDIPQDYMALVIKALLVHGAQWGPKGDMLDRLLGPRGQGQYVARRDNIARLLGYGVPDIQRVLDCTENRATLLGIGDIVPGNALLYQIPLPTGLDGVRAFRAFTVTLAWLSPVNPHHQGYRMAALDISPGSEEKYWVVKNRDSAQPSDKSVGRGTLFHERRTGEQAAVFVDDGHLMLRVSCRATAGEFHEPVPYAMAISFEVAEDAGIPVYDEIRMRLAAPVRASASS